ncbi:protein toll [Periplaneta americana]|uniref:protein toll n=1 Tax=Periplaneta americana TaxID=6978 RepID=UPI0037E812EB
MGQLLWAVVLALATVVGACTNSNKCQCQDNIAGGRGVWCGDMININIQPNKKIEFICRRRMSWSDYELLLGLHVGPVRLATFNFCPMPSIPLNQLFESIGISAVENIRIFNSNISDTLDSSFLVGLSNLTNLLIQGSGITTLPADIFHNVTAIKHLDLKENDLQLPAHVFDSLTKLEILELGGNHMSHLEEGIFRNQKNLHRLNLWGNNLRNLTGGEFAGLTSLKVLDLSSNGLTSLPAEVLAEMPQLKEINMFANNFSTLPTGLFSSSKNLTIVRLYDNRQSLAHIPSGLLANLQRLEDVSLYMCNITNLPNDTFWGSTAIANISLQWNGLTTLPSDLFRDVTGLKNLKLGHNQLHTLPNNIFSRLKRLQVLELGYNQLTNISGGWFEDLWSLERLDLQHNQLKYIAVQAFMNVPKLKWLNLSHNNLTMRKQLALPGDEQSVLNACIVLEELYLSHNNITTVFEDWTITMVKLKQLDLSYNKLSSLSIRDLQFLSDNIVANFTYNNISELDLRSLERMAREQDFTNLSNIRQRHILLEGNPLTCDCKAYDLLRYLEDKLEPEVRSMYDLIPGSLSCANPPELQGVPVTNVRSKQILCPLELQCGICPHQCTCYIRPAFSALIINCSDANLQHAPAELPDLIQCRKTFAQFRPNHTELWLENNSLETLPHNSSQGYNWVTHLHASHNNISGLSSEQLPRNLQELELDHNHLTRMNRSVLEALSNMTRITLHANPWQCDCMAQPLLSFLQEHFKQVAYLSNITCDNLGARSLTNLTITELCPMTSTNIVVASVLVAILGVMIGVSAALYYYYQQEVKVWLYAHGWCLWFVTEEELDKEKLYDAFISYSHRDEEFVVNELVPHLEGGATPFKLCLHYRDWIAGEWIPNQIARSVEDSRRTLVVLSPSFLESVWGRMEFRTAHSQALSEGRARVIVLLYGDIGPLDELDSELRAYLSMNTYVKWGDPWFWDKLRYALPHPQKSGVLKGMELKSKHAKDDKLELIKPSTPPTTTPPAETVINPLEAVNGHATLVTETNGHINNGYVKSV